MKYEWRKQDKALYGAKKYPALITIPAQNYIMISGKGNPNDVDFSNRVGALHSLAYAVKSSYKAVSLQEEIHDFAVYPLEGIWTKINGDYLDKAKLEYTIMIRQPDFISEEMVNKALGMVRIKKPTCEKNGIVHDNRKIFEYLSTFETKCDNVQLSLFDKDFAGKSPNGI